jgi:pimeloyl-ACP methyl ester carboxylesterase
MSCFILVHGGAHGGWCWDRLVPELEKLGHRALAPDLAGMGDDKTPIEQVSMAGWAAFVADLARRQGEPVILVGHSRGGPVIGEAAELDPDAVLGLVYLTALMLPPGKAVMDMFNPSSSALMEGATLSDDQRATIFNPESAAPVFYNTASAEDARWAASRLCPDPVAVNLTPSTVTTERWGKVPRAFIECTEDRAMPLSMQRAMQVEFPCDPVITLESDHSPFLSIPGVTAEALDRIARAFEARTVTAA